MPATDTDFDLRPLPQSAIPIGEFAFADVGNLEHCIKYLNQTLVTFGFPASLDLFANDPVSVARTCNCMYALVQQRQRDVEFRESANEQRQRLVSDISRLEAKVERLEGQLQVKDREIATMTRTEAKATAAFKAQIEKLQQERDEFQRMVIGNQERLNQVLMEKKKESRSGMEIMNLLQKEGRQRGTWNGKKADNDFHKKIVDAYEAKNQELMAENSDLKALLRSMQVDMRDFINAPNGLSKQSRDVNERVETDHTLSPLGGRTDVFDLPFHMARDQIEENLRNKMASIKERMVQLQDAQKEAEVTSEVTERELELEAQLVEARSIIQEQASIMAKQLAKSERPRNLNGSHFNSGGESNISSPAESRLISNGCFLAKNLKHHLRIEQRLPCGMIRLQFYEARHQIMKHARWGNYHDRISWQDAKGKWKRREFRRLEGIKSFCSTETSQETPHPHWVALLGSTEGVPFNWEMQPGTPRNPPKEEVIPPISPPPAVLSLGLPNPCIDQHPRSNKPPTSPLHRLKFWTKKSKKNKQRKNNFQHNVNVVGESDKFDKVEFCSSDSEFMASSTSPRNSSSSFSSSFSFSKGQCASLRSTPARDLFTSSGHFSCSPWKFS
ncbi:hypothetical protein DVH24_002200 [Malus domestica]|uniref:Afadin/alpha-actinin-binding protein n=1 Tax=Malus domestica TaxID=3750 RepID=A0A498I8Y0_MALDO|nr:hypothetical protein DVH24_002200 [Malus domestica]